MRFALHGSGSLPGIQIDWTAPVAVGPEVRGAMARHDVDQMQAGRLRRGYLARSILYERGAIALRVAEGHEIFLELPAAAAVTAAPVRAAVATAATVEHGDAVDRHRIVVGDPDDGERIDRLIVTAAPTLSRTIVQRLIDDGHVTVAGAPVRKSNRRVHRGETIELEVARTAEPAEPPAPS